MRLYGLTGGIGSGKSTVAGILRELGAPVIDADVLAREAVAPASEGLAEIRAEFGDAVLAADGSLDRKALAAVVFSDAQKRKRLEEITHPRIAALAMERARELAGAGHSVAFYEAALLVENGAYRMFDGLVVVTAPERVQIQRVMARDRSSEEQARARIAAQLPLADKVALATHVIDNAGDLEDTRRQTVALWRELSVDGSTAES